MYRWLIPAALVLPLWLLLGWAIFNAASQPWALLPVLLVFAPSVLVCELVFALLVRVRPSVRATRAVSWTDVGVFGVWHVLTILVGLYFAPIFAVSLILAVLAAVGVLWVTSMELRRESSQSRSAFLDTSFRERIFGDSTVRNNDRQPVIRIDEAPVADVRPSGD